MASVIIMCGRICSGKSTHARALAARGNAVILSVDEIMLALFGADVGAMHDTYVERLEAYLYEKSVEIVRGGVDVILDIGLWTRRERDEARAYYARRGIPMRIHAIAIGEDEWRRRIQRRNADIARGEVSAYPVDDGLARKFAAIFEPPGADEPGIVWIAGERTGT